MAAAPSRPSAEHPSTGHPSSEQRSGERSSPESVDNKPAQRDPVQRDPAPRAIDPQGPAANEEPSVEWGWHGSFPRAKRIAGWSTAAAMFFMLIGNHESNVENWWLIALGTGLVLLLLGEHLNRSPWRQ